VQWLKLKAGLGRFELANRKWLDRIERMHGDAMIMVKAEIKYVPCEKMRECRDQLYR
jgi:hypothetical protein